MPVNNRASGAEPKDCTLCDIQIQPEKNQHEPSYCKQQEEAKLLLPKFVMEREMDVTQ